MKAFFHYIKYAGKHRIYWLILLLLIIVGSVLSIVIFCPGFDFWTIYLAVLGVIIAIWILIVSLREEWIRDLPKKLTIHFLCNNSLEYFFSIYDAPLLSRDDIRAWGQQLGLNINNNKQLDLKYFELVSAKILYFNGKYYEHFEVKYYVGNANCQHKGYSVREYIHNTAAAEKIKYGFNEEKIDDQQIFKPLTIADLKQIQNSAEKTP